ncbi:hypothetical protein [Rhodohalobacter halophilus]|uniref:hypothetical protein n=1 Tax=Rhodohalobacter halophilus TaxID=1812810 RepID=UPI00083FBEF4|nr:hypothetical protein [Rhodohalobacter halophilus]
MELEREKFLFNLFGGYPSVVLNSYIVSSYIENIPDVCREIVQMVEETILPIDEQLEQIREQLDNNKDGG